MTADDTTLTPASKSAIAYYRKRAEEGGQGSDAWGWLADELEAFGETTGEHDGQGELL